MNIKDLVEKGWKICAEDGELKFINNFNNIVLYQDVYSIDFWKLNIPFNEKIMILDFVDEYFEGADYKSRMMNELRSAIAAHLTYELLKMDLGEMNISVFRDMIFVNFIPTGYSIFLSLNKKEIKFYYKGEIKKDSDFMVETVNHIEDIYNKVMDRCMQ